MGRGRAGGGVAGVGEEDGISVKNSRLGKQPYMMMIAVLMHAL